MSANAIQRRFGIHPQIRTTKCGLVEYAEFGEGIPVVAIHGAMGGWDQSALLAKTALGEGFRVIAVTRPGYLGTPLSAGRAPEEQADLIAALLDELGVAKCYAIAVSGGGPSAVYFGVRHPEKCLGLILVSVCVTRNKARIPLRFRFMELLARVPGVPCVLQRKAMSRMDAALIRAVRNSAVRERLRKDAEAYDLFRTNISSIFDCMGRRIEGTDNDIRISRAVDCPLGKLTVPVLVFHGTDDSVAEYGPNANALAVQVPGIRFIPLEGGGHAALFAHMGMIRREVSAFVAK